MGVGSGTCSQLSYGTYLFQPHAVIKCGSKQEFVFSCHRTLKQVKQKILKNWKGGCESEL